MATHPSPKSVRSPGTGVNRLLRATLCLLEVESSLQEQPVLLKDEPSPQTLLLLGFCFFLYWPEFRDCVLPYQALKEPVFKKKN